MKNLLVIGLLSMVKVKQWVSFVNYFKGIIHNFTNNMKIKHLIPKLLQGQ